MKALAHIRLSLCPVSFLELTILVLSHLVIFFLTIFLSYSVIGFDWTLWSSPISVLVDLYDLYLIPLLICHSCCCCCSMSMKLQSGCPWQTVL